MDGTVFGIGIRKVRGTNEAGAPARCGLPDYDRQELEITDAGASEPTRTRARRTGQTQLASVTASGGGSNCRRGCAGNGTSMPLHRSPLPPDRTWNVCMYICRGARGSASSRNMRVGSGEGRRRAIMLGASSHLPRTFAEYPRSLGCRCMSCPVVAL